MVGGEWGGGARSGDRAITLIGGSVCPGAMGRLRSGAHGRRLRRDVDGPAALPIPAKTADRGLYLGGRSIFIPRFSKKSL